MAGPSTFARHVAGGLVSEMWSEEALNEEIITEEPVLGMSKKETNWGTNAVHHPLGWGGNQGVGRTFADAKRLKSHAQEDEFVLRTREMFATLSLEGKLLRAFEYNKQKHLLVDPIKREGERAIDIMRQRLSKAVHGNGVGILAGITSGSNVLTNTVTLTDGNDLKQFMKDYAIQTINTNGTGGTLNDSGAEARIYSVGSEDNPTLTLSTTWAAAFPSIAAGHYIVGTGTYDDDYIYGLDGFNPEWSSPSSLPADFLTCVRSVNPGWLAGLSIDGRNLSFLQAAKKAARYLVDRGEKPDTVLCSTRDFERFEFENKPELVKFPAEKMGKMNLGVEYTGAVIQGPRGPLKIVPSSWMPDNVMRVGEMKHLTFGSIGPLVHWDMDNGPKQLRTEDGTDNRELRAVSDPAFLNKRPGAWCRVKRG
jgi:hypothetical protein